MELENVTLVKLACQIVKYCQKISSRQGQSYVIALGKGVLKSRRTFGDKLKPLFKLAT